MRSISRPHCPIPTALRSPVRPLHDAPLRFVAPFYATRTELGTVHAVIEAAVRRSFATVGRIVRYVDTELVVTTKVHGAPLPLSAMLTQIAAAARRVSARHHPGDGPLAVTVRGELLLVEDLEVDVA